VFHTFSRTTNVCVRCRRTEASGTPVSEQISAQAQETSHVVLASADYRTREAVSAAEILGVRWTLDARQDAQDDWRSGQDLVPEQTYQVEVITRTHALLRTCVHVTV